MAAKYCSCKDQPKEIRKAKDGSNRIAYCKACGRYYGRVRAKTEARLKK